MRVILFSIAVTLHLAKMPTYRLKNNLRHSVKRRLSSSDSNDASNSCHC